MGVRVSAVVTLLWFAALAVPHAQQTTAPPVGSIVRGRTNGASGVERVVFNDRMWETRRETFLPELKQRIRDVRQGLDGLIYLLTEEVDGGVFKLEPADQ